jgi:hypothetical protein
MALQLVAVQQVAPQCGVVWNSALSRLLGWQHFHTIFFKIVKRNLTVILLGTKYFGHHFSVTSKKNYVNQALTSSQHR